LLPATETQQYRNGLFLPFSFPGYLFSLTVLKKVDVNLKCYLCSVGQFDNLVDFGMHYALKKVKNKTDAQKYC